MMKISKITITSFGKFKNKEINFNENYNEFILDNGEGKSTILSFIFAMFYGVGSNQTGLRKYYIPWNEVEAKGSIVFNYKDTEYRIDRVFGKTPIKDKVSLYNLNKGEIEEIKEESLGKHFFNLDEQSFKETIYLKNMDVVVNSTNNLNDLLINTINTGNVASNLSLAFARLSDFNKIINDHKNTKENIGCKIKEERNSLIEDINKLEESNNELNLLVNELEEIKKEEEALNKKKEYYNLVISYQKEKKNYDEYLTYLDLLNNKEIEETIIIKDENKDNYLKEINDINQENIKKKDLSIFYILAPLFFCLLITSLLLFEKIKTRLFVAIPLLVFLILDVTYILYNHLKYKKELEILNKKKENVYLKYDAKTYEIAYFNINNKFIDKKEVIKHDNPLYLDFISKHDIDNLNKYKDFICNHEYDLIDNPIILLEDINNKLLEINSKKGRIIERLETKDNSMELALKKAKLVSLNNKLDHLHYLSECSSIANDLLYEASDEIYHNFTPIIKASLLENINKITDGRFKDLLIDKEFNISLEEDGQMHELFYFSQGYKDLIYIALRMTLIFKALKDDKAFIILDDPLVNLDSNNKKRVLNYLKELANDYQILYFSCNN